jgi:hypothetical protein
MLQRGRSVRIRRRGQIGDACGCMQQQRRRHQCREAIGDARALAMIGAVAAAFTIRSGCLLRRAALVHTAMRHAVIRHSVIRHAAVRVRYVRAHVCVTGRFGSSRGNSRRGRSDDVMCTSRMRRRHRTTHAVRHQGEAEQGVQQERAKAHCRSVLPTYSARSRSVHLHANCGHIRANSSAAARFSPLAKAGSDISAGRDTSLLPAPRGEGGAKRRIRGRPLCGEPRPPTSEHH